MELSKKMRYVLITYGILMALSFSSCSSNNKEARSEDSVPMPIEVEMPKSEIKLAGIWNSKDNPLYPTLEFKGKSTVVIKTIMGPFATSYERDEEFIRVRTDQSDLLFEVISADSIVGSGYAKGVWIKEQ